MAIDLELRYRGLQLPAQAQVGGLRLRPRVRRGPVEGLRRHRHLQRLEPVRRRQRRRHPAPRGPAGPGPDDAELIKLIDRFLMFYIRTADRLERTSTWLERIPGGLDHVRDVVVEDSLGICEELESLMTAHVAHYADEWADHHQRPREARPVRVLRERPGHPRPGRRLRPRARPDQARPAAAVHRHATRRRPGRKRPAMTLAPETTDLKVQLRLDGRTGSRSAT